MVVLEEGKSNRRNFIRKLTGLTAIGAVAGLLSQKSTYTIGINFPRNENPNNLDADLSTQAREPPIHSASYTVSTDGSSTKAESSATGEID